MTAIKITAKNFDYYLWKKILSAAGAVVLLVAIVLGNSGAAVAQFTFMGDYDKSFAAPLGYYVDPQDPVTPAGDTYQTQFYTGEFAPDGSIIAGGRYVDGAPRGDFYLRKFTPTGAIDTAFGTGGYVRTNFHSRFDGVPGNDIPQVLKVQPDGKIIFAGYCTLLEPGPFPAAAFGDDACVVRYNANGTLDATFGGGTLAYTNGTTQLDPGKVIFQTGLIADGQSFGTNGTYYDMAIQPDGKIVLVGVTRNRANSFVVQGYGAIVVRLNPNGSLDSTFGSGGIARWNAPESPAGCFPTRAFHGVRLQPDGRILAVGYNSTNPCNGASSPGSRFVVTRWTSSGQLETVRHLDNDTAFNFQDEGAGSVLLTRDGKILVSGVYKNLTGSGFDQSLLTMVRLNLSDLSIDTTFANNGIRQHSSGGIPPGFNTGGRLIIRAIQPDGKILAVDSDSNGNVIRFNPDGTFDQSFGNGAGGLGLLGKLRANVTNFNGSVGIIQAGQILVRPNGRINLIGYSDVGIGFQTLRAAVSQQNTVFENGVYSDFTNDGRSDIGVFRDGFWFYLNSTDNQSNGVQFGQAGDKPAPADYDGDGKTDVAVFRNGIWYLQQSTKGFSGIAFGAAGDLPRPGDFDGDGRADIAVFRPSNGVWYISRSSDNQFYGVGFGQAGDAPLLADFDADGKSDIAVYRAGIWYYIQSSDNQFRGIQFGASEDVPVQGDYDADSRTDIAVFRPSNGVWYRINSSTSEFVAQPFGASGDRPAPGDYDNDGKNDLAVYRSGIWYVQQSGDNSFFGIAYGAPNDVPVQSAFLP